ncbi:transcriptional regulator [Brachyspira pilosicoli]|uniref:8-oxoguanine DNA glycosylase/AP lyase n=1 Tax=Brachyspira pilosicoli TaxID=52584 RepID=A0AAJ6GAD9_BRAPL|nr:MULTISPECIES: transcriptional regulator [Brachyspira]WIH91417.1 transcriptional regulator [Brachyspira pilosicoli]WIH93708.1 transcriptional regulator [Brachyspira pilosicoli]WIH95996.1 transcriptional regulator [Brachyspira pilosicoli]SUW00323.1 N-glycosylase/DNA lyase [Brachyspira pilosicoli]
MDKEYAKHLMGIYKDKILHERMKRRLEYFERVYKRENDKRLFAELAFCICTPQTKARSGAAAIIDLYNHNLLFKGSEESIANILIKHVRFHNMKARNIVLARKLYFPKEKFILRERIDDAIKNDSIVSLRNELAKEVKGYGLKEASHFLRNIGFGQKIAILDRHIMRVMSKLDILPESMTPKTSLTKNNYMSCEANLVEYSKKEKIPMEYLDFVFWYDATNDIFK